jgi:hypothetical protein
MTNHHTAWFLILLGILFLLGSKLPFVGHLPGDFHIHGKHAHVSLPLGTCLVASMVFSIVMWLLKQR